MKANIAVYVLERKIPLEGEMRILGVFSAPILAMACADKIESDHPDWQGGDRGIYYVKYLNGNRYKITRCEVITEVQG